MSVPLAFPKLDWHHAMLLQTQQKKAELIIKRDRLNQRIESLQVLIDRLEIEIKPETIAKKKVFWDQLREKDDL
jgi:hypothetical protein